MASAVEGHPAKAGLHNPAEAGHYNSVPEGFSSVTPYVWVPGLLDDANPSAPENWNLDITVRRSLLWPYCGKSVGIWRCPADTSFGINNLGQRVPRVRSVTMSNWVGGNGNSPETNYKGYWGLASPNSVVYRKLSQIRRPSMTFVFS